MSIYIYIKGLYEKEDVDSWFCCYYGIVISVLSAGYVEYIFLIENVRN